MALGQELNMYWRQLLSGDSPPSRLDILHPDKVLPSLRELNNMSPLYMKLCDTYLEIRQNVYDAVQFVTNHLQIDEHVEKAWHEILHTECPQAQPLCNLNDAPSTLVQQLHLTNELTQVEAQITEISASNSRMSSELEDIVQEEQTLKEMLDGVQAQLNHLEAKHRKFLKSTQRINTDSQQ